MADQRGTNRGSPPVPRTQIEEISGIIRARPGDPPLSGYRRRAGSATPDKPVRGCDLKDSKAPPVARATRHEPQITGLQCSVAVSR